MGIISAINKKFDVERREKSTIFYQTDGYTFEVDNQSLKALKEAVEFAIEKRRH